jgi:hypothetical protein
VTDQEITQLIQAAVNELAVAVNAEVNQALGSLSTAIEENRQALATVAGAVADTLLDRPTTPVPPSLGEITVRLEPAPSPPTTKRVERDTAGNITRIVDESTGP